VLTRRSFVRTAALGAAAAAVGLPAVSVLDAAPAGAATNLAGTDPDLHLLRRATHGPTPAALKRLRKIGRRAWLDEQLDPASIDDSACAELVATRWPHLSLSITDLRANVPEFSWDTMFELGQASLARAAWSKRQLFEVMVDFWSNHLNVTNPFDGGWDNRHDYDRRVIRKHAMGRFEDMLLASAQHPSMMLYLNNAESTKYSPNENYGRELLELHTVGVDGGYDETDMRTSALVMTGFGYDWETGLFRYWAQNHHTGPLSVMGWSSANPTGAGGLNVGLDYVRYLARHRRTAERIAWKLCRRFVSDTPSPGLVDTLADVYRANDTAIVPVLRTLFRSAAFANAIGSKVRRPTEDVVATIRTLGLRATATEGDLPGLYWMAESLGNAPMGWHQPDGYPDDAVSWASAGGTLNRWNMHQGLAANWWPKLVRDPLSDLLPTPLPATHGEAVQALAQRLLYRKLPATHLDAVCAFVGKTPASPLTSTSELVRWRLPYVVALILDSPIHGIR
jgi:uncharacterized protein (DUF1800 family)